MTEDEVLVVDAVHSRSIRIPSQTTPGDPVEPVRYERDGANRIHTRSPDSWAAPA